MPVILVPRRNDLHHGDNSVVTRVANHHGLRLGRVDVEFRPGSAVLSLDGRAYRGSFRLLRAGSKLRVVNAVDLDLYRAPKKEGE